ncbi:MAG TPA: SdpI family protein [Gammaproteobacteria bacterium]|nr:SdpI family protein [Gammaproteobacteria bacterium]
MTRKTTSFDWTTIFGCALTVACFAAAAMLYDKLPGMLPVHWGLHGNANRFMAKPWGVYIYPIIVGAMLILKVVLPAISPRAFAIEPFKRTFNILMTALLLFSAYLMGVVYAHALGADIPVGRAVIAGLGALFVVIGNFLGKVTKNFFIGIRTPWTLANDDVWFKTHRLGGWLMVLCGFVTIAVAILGRFYPAMIAALGIAIVVPVVYSLVLGLRLDRADKHDELKDG